MGCGFVVLGWVVFLWFRHDFAGWTRLCSAGLKMDQSAVDFSGWAVLG